MAEDAQPGLALLVALAAEVFFLEVFRGFLDVFFVVFRGGGVAGRHGRICLGGGVDVAAERIDGAELERRFGDALGEDVEAARLARVEGEAPTEFGVLVEDWMRRRGQGYRARAAGRAWHR